MMKNRSLLTTAAFLALAINGLLLTYLGTCLPEVQKYLDIDISQAGKLMAVLQAGFTIFSLCAGILSDYYHRERILCGGCLLLGGASLFFCISTSYVINVILVFLMGAGIGCILSGSNTLLVTLYPDKKGTILNIHHIFFGLGSLVGPLLVAYLIAQKNMWREGFAGQALVLFLLSCYFLFSPKEQPSGQGRAGFSYSQVKKLLKDNHFWTILVANGLAMGTQVTIMLLGVTFLLEAKGCSLTVAGTTLAVFSLFIMFGRLLCSRLTMVYRHSTIIFILLWLQLLTLCLAWLGNGWIAIFALALSGLGFSGVYPTMLALAGLYFPQVTGSALGILSTIGGLGSILLCWVTGYVASLTSMGRGFTVLVLACLTAVVLFGKNHNILCQRESAAIATSIGRSNEGIT